MVGEVADLDGLAVGEAHGALDDVVELADVSRPVVVHHAIERRAADLFDAALAVAGLVEAAGLEELLDEQGRVFFSIAERREDHAHDAQAVEEVFAEATLADLFGEVPIGGGDDADVDLDGLGATDALHLALLEHAQEFRLQVELELAELVQEHGAAVGHLEDALARGGGAGEGALLVAEEFALDEVLGDGAAVEDHEGAVAASRGRVGGAGDDLFAGAGLALDHDGGIGRRDLLEDGVDLAHLGVAPDEVAEARAVGGDDAELLVDGPEAKIGRAQGERGARHEEALADPHAVDERPVGRAQIAHQVGVALLEDAAVITTDGLVGQHQVVVFGGADVDDVAVERVGLDLVAPHQLELTAAKRDLGRATFDVVELGRLGRDHPRKLLGTRDPSQIRTDHSTVSGSFARSAEGLSA